MDLQNKNITRRNFLKFSMQAPLGIMLFVKKPFRSTPASFIDPSSPLVGRVLHDNAVIYDQPSFSASVKYHLRMNNLLPISNELIGDAINEHSKIWYEVTDYGFMPANSVQLVRQQLNSIRDQVNNGGELGTITVAFTKAWKGSPSNTDSEEYQLFFYGSNHWIKGVFVDEKGDTYYKIVEDRWGDIYYVTAQHVAIYAEEELLPLASEIPLVEKHIEVNIHDQIVIAYENGKPVFLSPAATGILDDGIDLSTPPGEYEVNYKRPSRHMVHSDKIGINDSELYGVPWVTYFTDTGIAFHGTYWHNDFGVPRSHGCVNLPIPAAKWIYLWTDPIVPPRQDTFVSNYGTRVIVT